MPKKIKLFLNSEQKVSKLIFGVLMVGLAVLVAGNGAFAYFQRTASDSNYDYGYGYGGSYGYGYGYGYGADVSGYNDYGFYGADGKATALFAAQSGSSRLVVGYTTDYYAKNKVYYSATSAACSSLTSSVSQTVFQTGANSATISDLTCGTTYYYCVASEDAGGNTWYTSVANADTGACGGSGGGGGSVAPSTSDTIVSQTMAGAISSASGGSVVLTTSEGSKAEVVMPAGASTANLTVSVQSKSAASAEAAGTVGVAPTGVYRVGNLVFEFSAQDASTNQAVSQFSKDITLSFTYTDAQIAGLSEDSLQVYTWQNGAWAALTGVIDKVNNKITITVNHFSYFSIMGQKSATSTTITTATSTITKAINQMTVTELRAKIKEVLSLMINLLSQMIGQWQTQLQAMVHGQSAPAVLKTLDINLKYGSMGDAVKLLQTWLSQDKDIYPLGVINGTFGPATKAAVIKFQEKYASEILTPAGLINGNGLVGAGTRAKLNSLYGSQ